MTRVARVLITVVAFVMLFVIAVALAGPSIGANEIGIWFVALLVASILVYRGRRASTLGTEKQ